jgi:hypothetical protein
MANYGVAFLKSTLSLIVTLVVIGFIGQPGWPMAFVAMLGVGAAWQFLADARRTTQAKRVYADDEITGPCLPIGSYIGVLRNGALSDTSEHLRWSVALFGRNKIVLSRTRIQSPSNNFWPDLGQGIVEIPKSSFQKAQVHKFTVDPGERMISWLGDAATNLVTRPFRLSFKSVPFDAVLLILSGRQDNPNVYLFGIPSNMDYDAEKAGDFLLEQVPGRLGTALGALSAAGAVIDATRSDQPGHQVADLVAQRINARAR